MAIISVDDLVPKQESAHNAESMTPSVLPVGQSEDGFNWSPPSQMWGSPEKEGKVSIAKSLVEGVTFPSKDEFAEATSNELKRMGQVLQDSWDDTVKRLTPDGEELSDALKESAKQMRDALTSGFKGIGGDIADVKRMAEGLFDGKGDVEDIMARSQGFDDAISLKVRPASRMSKAGAVPDYRKKGNAFFDFFSYEAFRPKMSPVDLINHIGPDFMSNKFDAFFVWRGADGSLKPLNHFDMPSLLDIDASTNGELLLPDVKPYTASTEEASTHYMKQILSRYGFAVRLSSVTIPAQHHEEFSTPFLETNVSRIRSTRAYSNESKFALRMDQDLLWLDAMQKLAGRNITYDVFISNGLNEVNPWYDATTLRTFEETFRTVSSSWSRATLSSEEKPVDVKSTRLSLIVRITQLSNIVNVYWQDKRPPFFVFDDVKFLGPSDGIHYSRENADTQDVEFGFIFKRLYKVSPSYVAQKSNSFVYNTASNIPVIPQMGGALTGDDKYKISTGLETKDIALEDS